MIYAIPRLTDSTHGGDVSTNGFTIGRRYPVLRWEGHQSRLAVVRNDNGHERVVGEGPSAHIKRHWLHTDPTYGTRYMREVVAGFFVLSDES